MHNSLQHLPDHINFYLGIQASDSLWLRTRKSTLMHTCTDACPHCNLLLCAHTCPELQKTTAGWKTAQTGLLCSAWQATLVSLRESGLRWEYRSDYLQAKAVIVNDNDIAKQLCPGQNSDELVSNSDVTGCSYANGQERGRQTCSVPSSVRNSSALMPQCLICNAHHQGAVTVSVARSLYLLRYGIVRCRTLYLYRSAMDHLCR
jgi:hypothetical protein